RELALRAATGLPGMGGDAAAGQLAGISGVKMASVCAAGAIAAGCLATGIAPAVGVLELAQHHRHRNPPKMESAPALSPPSTTTSAPALSPLEGRSTQTSNAAKANTRSAKDERNARSSRKAPARSLAQPTSSPSQTASEFGVESAGSDASAGST